MEIKLSISKFKKGEEVYLYDGSGSCLVTITDVYKWGNNWYYDIDANNYAKGFELEFVPEGALGKSPWVPADAKPFSYMTMRRLYMEFKNR